MHIYIYFLYSIVLCFSWAHHYPSGHVNSMYWSWYLNFQGFRSASDCTAGSLATFQWISLQLLVLVRQAQCVCSACAVRVPCKRCCCCGGGECALTIWPSAWKKQRRHTQPPSLITQTAVLWLQHFLFWAGPPLLRLEKKSPRGWGGSSYSFTVLSLPW